jgi:transcriptional antiterminator RfaH
MHWYLVHTKPRQEKRALQNLEQQGYECYLPTMPVERLRHDHLDITREPLFPRYLFIRLSMDNSAKSWGPIRSTLGVNRIVSFGSEPARINDNLISLLKLQETTLHDEPKRLFSPGDRVQLTAGAFAGIEGIYQMADGEQRVMVLIELLSKPVAIPAHPATLRKVS